MNEYTRSNAHTQILRTVKDFSRILGVELAIAEMACVSRNIRTAVPAAYGIPVQRSISERDVSHPLKKSLKLLLQTLRVVESYPFTKFDKIPLINFADFSSL